jgi:serine/threonine protein kinase
VGPYRLLRRLGSGGQGTVYLGTDGGPEPVAVKVLDTDFHDTGRLKTALNRELASAQSVAAFVTAGIITFDLDADPPYIVTEFVDGPTLHDEVRYGRGPLRGSRLADVAIQTVIALEAIHAANVIHCDVKPGNIILGPGGVKVIDFGIARAWDEVHQAASRVIGSAHFMAPEQIDSRPLGPPADMFAWGATMVFAATGEYAFPGTNPVAVGLRVVQDEPDLHGLGGPLGDLVRACLAKDPARRPTAAQVRQALMAPSAAAAAQPAPPPRRRRRVLIPLAVLLVLLAAAGAGYGWWSRDRGGTRQPLPDPQTQALQAFAGKDLSDCRDIRPNARQLVRRSCPTGGAEVTYSLYKNDAVDERAAERARVVVIHDRNSPPACLRRTGTSPDGRRGDYIEYTYQAGDDKKMYVAIWWDDGRSNPAGSAVMTMRQGWDGKNTDPARPLRERWLGWGYRLDG